MSKKKVALASNEEISAAVKRCIESLKLAEAEKLLNEYVWVLKGFFELLQGSSIFFQHKAVLFLTHAYGRKPQTLGRVVSNDIRSCYQSASSEEEISISYAHWTGNTFLFLR